MDHYTSLKATSSNGNITISETVVVLPVDDISATSGGDVNLVAQGGSRWGKILRAHLDRKIKGGTVTLQAMKGSIGTSAKPLQMESGTALKDYVSVISTGDVCFDELTGDLRLKQVVAGNDVGIGILTGSLLDVNQDKEVDERTVQECATAYGTTWA